MEIDRWMWDVGWGTGTLAGRLVRHPSPGRGYVRPMHVFAPILLPLMLLFPTQGESQPSKASEPQSQKAAEKDAPVPKQYLPPPGMCRIWVDNVPANRQPAPTDCATAIRNKPPNARVVFPAGREGRAGEPKSLPPGRGRADTTKRKPPD